MSSVSSVLRILDGVKRRQKAPKCDFYTLNIGKISHKLEKYICHTYFQQRISTENTQITTQNHMEQTKWQKGTEYMNNHLTEENTHG